MLGGRNGLKAAAAGAPHHRCVEPPCRGRQTHQRPAAAVPRPHRRLLPAAHSRQPMPPHHPPPPTHPLTRPHSRKLEKHVAAGGAEEQALKGRQLLHLHLKGRRAGRGPRQSIRQRSTSSSRRSKGRQLLHHLHRMIICEKASTCTPRSSVGRGASLSGRAPESPPAAPTRRGGAGTVPEPPGATHAAATAGTLLLACCCSCWHSAACCCCCCGGGHPAPPPAPAPGPSPPRGRTPPTPH